MRHHAAARPIDDRPTRRAVTRAAAWSVPVLAVAATAPAYAASCRPFEGVTFSSWSGTTSEGGLAYAQTYTPPAGAFAVPVTMSVRAAYAGSMKPGSEFRGGPDLFDVLPRVGGTGKPGLGLIQSVTSSRFGNGPGRAARGTYTFSYTQPVTNLVLTLTDIDRTDGDFLDRVEIGGAWREVSRGGGITGSGTESSPWLGGAAYDDAGSSAGNVTVRFDGPVSGFTVTYWNAETRFGFFVDRNQGVYLSDLSFDYEPC